MINVNYKGNEYTTEKGKQVIDFIKEKLDVELITILACKINHEVKSLNFSMQEDCNLDLIDSNLDESFS